MINLNGYNDVQVGSGDNSPALPAGAYVAHIVNAFIGSFQDGSQGLFVAIEIAEGDFVGYFRKQFERFKKFAPNARWADNGIIKIPLYDDNGKIHWRLKKFLETVKQDNPTKINIVADSSFDERNLIGLNVGVVVGEKESQKTKQNGEHFVNPYVSYAITIDAVRSGNFKIPDLKKYQGNSTPNNSGTVMFDGQPAPEYETPF